MNRSIDSRSDLYSFGVTLYEMLTGLLPFTASAAMEWIHCHVARQPVPPDERAKGIPRTISAIVMRLLAKTAEERYQTAAGVEADLRRCLAEWEKLGRIDLFPLGTHDASDRLWIPERLRPGSQTTTEAYQTASVRSRRSRRFRRFPGRSFCRKSLLARNELVLLPAGDFCRPGPRLFAFCTLFRRTAADRA
jgi:serine/threonine protein kinase